MVKVELLLEIYYCYKYWIQHKNIKCMDATYVCRIEMLFDYIHNLKKGTMIKSIYHGHLNTSTARADINISIKIHILHVSIRHSLTLI